MVLGLAYDGAGFHGFAAQPGQRTVAGLLVSAFSQLGAGEVSVTCAGRTDAGVHALAQVVHVDVPSSVVDRRRQGAAHGDGLPWLAKALSGLCGPEVAIWRAAVAPEGFDARRSAVARRYRYELATGDRVDPLCRHSAWHVDRPLDIALLRLAADPLVGEHDFSAFCRRPPGHPVGPITRVVHDARWEVTGPASLRFEIEAGSFCHQMVRSIVGALVAVGEGRLRPSDIAALLRRASREGAPSLSPPHGLYLAAVRYPEALGGWWS
ncbi:MAG: tRNA pseudouridine(38-40) synthase TruA [Acidimicrobiales bacterium]